MSVRIRLAGTNPAGCIASDKGFRIIFFVVFTWTSIWVLQVGLVSHKLKLGLACSAGTAAV